MYTTMNSRHLIDLLNYFLGIHSSPDLEDGESASKKVKREGSKSQVRVSIT